MKKPPTTSLQKWEPTPTPMRNPNLALIRRLNRPTAGNVRPISKYRANLLKHLETDWYMQRHKFSRTRAELRQDAERTARNQKFYNPKTCIQALKALVSAHKNGLRFKYDHTYSENYFHPHIYEYAIPAKGKVVFKKGTFVTTAEEAKAQQNFENFLVVDHAIADAYMGRKPEIRKPHIVDKVQHAAESQARDVAFLALSINLPYWSASLKQGEMSFLTWIDAPPQALIKIDGFARTYAKFAHLPNENEFVQRVESWYKRMHSDHWDHPADHL